MEKDPLTYAYGAQQGRVPLSITVFNKSHAYVLGHETLQDFPYRHGDYVELIQNVDLGSTPLLTFAADIMQPDLPTERTVSGHYVGETWVPTAYLWRGNAFGAFAPFVYSQIYAPFSIGAGDTLRVRINNGSGLVTKDVVFVGGDYSASELVAELNSKLDGEAVASVYGTDLDYSRVKIAAVGTGNTASIEIRSAVGSDANDHLDFHKKIGSVPYPDTAFYGGDDLTLLVAPHGNFTAADVNQPLSITGASNPFNNTCTSIIKVLSATQVLLADSLFAETAGFAAVIPGCLWEFSVLIDTWKALSIIRPPSRRVYANNFSVNVSKLTGTHPVTFRLELITA